MFVVKKNDEYSLQREIIVANISYLLDNVCSTRCKHKIKVKKCMYRCKKDCITLKKLSALGDKLDEVRHNARHERRKKH